MHGGRRLARRALGVALFVVMLAVALAIALLTPYFLAARSSSLALLTFSSVVTFAFLVWLAVKAAAFVSTTPGVKRWGTTLAGLLTATFFGALYFAILRPSASSFPDVVPYSNTRYWTLSTGSVIAYSEFDPPTGTEVKPEAIVYLHGGPGVRQGPFDQDCYGALAALGFRVFLFDQAGSGLSGFLPHIRDYTMERSVEDLEGVRQKIGVERMILIGHSWGSTLAATYMAKYPSHVSKVMFHSPARLWDLEQDTYDFSRTAGGSQSLPAPRLLAALLLRDRNPDAAENLLPQKESEMLVVPSFRQSLGSVVCAGDFGKLPADLIGGLSGKENPGVNPYVLQQLVPATENPALDPHDALRQNKTPAILLYPECNYLSWEGAVDYRKTLTNLKIYYIPRSGHYIQFEQAELLKRILSAFLLDKPDEIAPYTSDLDPRLNRR